MIRIDLRHSTDKISEHCVSSVQPMFGSSVSFQKSIPTLNLQRGAQSAGDLAFGKYDKKNYLLSKVGDAELNEQFCFVTSQL